MRIETRASIPVSVFGGPKNGEFYGFKLNESVTGIIEEAMVYMDSQKDDL